MANGTQDKSVGGRPKIFTDAVYAAIPLWVNQGLSREDIAERIGTTSASLSAICSQKRIPLVPATVSDAAWGAIEAEARKWQITTECLIALVMERVATDNLFKAILDFNEPRRGITRR